MNKTVTANISGFIFNIEEDAYKSLQRYLNAVAATFSGMEGSDEIIADIEGRIAELFQEKLNNKRQVIISSDVDEIKEIMGAPEDYSSEAAEAESSYSYEERKSYRKVFRDPDDHVLGGVCSGLAHRLKIDALWVRLLFVFFAFLGGLTILVYIILWIIIPEAKSTAEKLQMKGEQVTIENIKKKVNEEFDGIKDGFKAFGEDAERLGKESGASIKGFVENTSRGLGSVLKAIGNVLFKFIGVIFILISMGFLISLIIGLPAGVTFLNGAESLGWEDISELFLFGSANLTFAIVAAVLILFIPIIILFYLGARLLGIIKTRVRGLGLSLFALFIVGIIMASIVGVSVGREYSMEQEVKESYDLFPPNDTLHIGLASDIYFHDEIRSHGEDFVDMIEFDGEQVVYGQNVKLQIRETEDDYYSLTVYREAHGPSQRKAINHAENIEYEYTANDSVVELSPYLKAPRSDHFRGQFVDVVVRVPEGKVVSFDKNIGRIYWNGSRGGNTYLMTDSKLESID